MEVKSTPNGILIVEHNKTQEQKQKEKLAERKFGLLEYRLPENREKINKMLCQLYSMNSRRGGIQIPGNEGEFSIKEARQQLIYYVATQLLGEDWGCEELC